MAVTKIWDIKGRIDQVITYASNPSKTKNEMYTDYDLQCLRDVMDYTMDDYKTEKQYFVSGINCMPEMARQQMTETKKRVGKTDGIVAYHGYQSFAPDEVTPDIAHKIGVELAREMWGERFEVVVATHVNSHCIHNHFVLNSVSYVDGKKYNDCNETYRMIRKISDRLCDEYSLSVVRNPKPSVKKCRTEYLAEENGSYTKNSIIKRDIDECISSSLSTQEFLRKMEERGYGFNFSRKYATITHPNFPKARRLKTLGDDYMPVMIKNRILKNTHSENSILPEQEDEQIIFFGNKGNDVFKSYRVMYVHFVCGIRTVKERPDSNRQMQYLLKDELLKLDRLIEEQNLLCGNDIHTRDQLLEYKGKAESEMSELIEARRILRNDLKKAVRMGNTAEQSELKYHISVLSQKIKKCRRDITVCERILEDKPMVEEKLRQIQDYSKTNQRKEHNNYERFR